MQGILFRGRAGGKSRYGIPSDGRSALQNSALASLGAIFFLAQQVRMTCKGTERADRFERQDGLFDPV